MAALLAALMVCSSAYAADATWTPDSISGDQTLTGGGTITLDGAVTVGDVTFSDNADYRIAGSSWEGTGDIIKNGTGTLTIAHLADLNTSGKLIINEGMVVFGGTNTADNNAPTMAFSEIQINAGTTFKYWARSKDAADAWGDEGDHRATNIVLNGGTWYHHGMGYGSVAYFNELRVTADSSFAGYWDGNYSFAKLTGSGNLAANVGVGPVKFEITEIENYGGTLTAGAAADTFIISKVKQAAGYQGTLSTQEAVTANHFEMTGAGSLTITNSLNFTGLGASIMGGTLNLQGGFTGDVGLTLGSADGNVGKLVTGFSHVNNYAGDMILNGGALELTGQNTSITKKITIGDQGGEIISSASGDLIFENIFSFTAAGTLDFGSKNVDLSKSIIDLSHIAADGSTHTLFTTEGTLTGGYDVFGLSGRSDYDLVENANSITFTLRHQEAAQNLSWSTGAVTWQNEGANEWETGASDKKFYQDDRVTFGSAGDSPAAAANEVTLVGAVTPGAVTLVGSQDWTLAGDGSITGATSLQHNGTGVLSINTNNSYQGGTHLSSSGTLVIGAEKALGEGALTLSGSATVKVAAGVKASINANGIAASTNYSGDNFYIRSTEGYTIELGDGSTLSDNVRLALGSGTTTIKTSAVGDTGTYEIDSFVLSSENSVTNLEIQAGATLKITGTHLSVHGSSENNTWGSFMLSEWNRSNVVNVYGVLDSAAGISNRDSGSAVLNVKTGGELILRRGLASVSNSKTAPTLNVEGTLTLFDKNTDGAVGNLRDLTVNIKAGATINAGEAGITTISDSLNYAGEGVINFKVADSGQTLVLNHDVTLHTAALSGDGEVNIARSFTANTLNAEKGFSIAATGELTVSDTLKVGDLSFARANESQALQLSSRDGVNAATVSQSAVTRSSTAQTDLDNVHMNNLLAENWKNAKLTNSKLESSTINASSFVVQGSSELADTTVTSTSFQMDAATLTVSGSSNQWDSVSLTDGALVVADASSVTLTGTTVFNKTNVSLQGTGAIVAEAGSTLELAGASLTTLDSITYNDKASNTLVLRDMSLSGSIDGSAIKQPIDTLEGGQIEMSLLKVTFDPSLEGFQSVMFKGDLTLTLTIDSSQDGWDAMLADGGVAFDFGTGDLSTMSYENAHFIVQDLGGTQLWTGTALGRDGTSIAYIPEPSSATLSLLALAGLAARRRRKRA